MDFKLDENTLWIIGILALVLFLFPPKCFNGKADKKCEKVKEEEICKEKCEEKCEEKCIDPCEEKMEEKCECDYIYRRKKKERKRLVYDGA